MNPIPTSPPKKNLNFVASLEKLADLSVEENKKEEATKHYEGALSILEYIKKGDLGGDNSKLGAETLEDVDMMSERIK